MLGPQDSRREAVWVCATLIALGSVLGCGPARRSAPEPGEQEFRAASLKILAGGDGVAQGNNEEATLFAQEMSDLLGSRDKQYFEGHHQRIVSLTGEKFLTYCQINGDRVAFLIHVPQLKRYKGGVREALIHLAWTTAVHVLSHSDERFSTVGIGLRGAVFYGGRAIGPINGEPEIRNAGVVSTKPLLPFFVQVSPDAVKGKLTP